MKKWNWRTIWIPSVPWANEWERRWSQIRREIILPMGVLCSPNSSEKGEYVGALASQRHMKHVLTLSKRIFMPQECSLEHAVSGLSRYMGIWMNGRLWRWKSANCDGQWLTNPPDAMMSESLIPSDVNYAGSKARKNRHGSSNGTHQVPR